MELGVAVAGAASGASALWGYNRNNFLFDREMRQKNEFQVLEYRNRQSELWREDIRDIIGLTEKKMDSYLIVGTLQLGMCVGLFTEGRLEPGTPPWLLHFYMLTLGAAFMYLLMSVWLAMHASVVAQCSSVRLLTQFVRLPVPTWEALENLRTYAEGYEKVPMKHMLRVPFLQTRSAPSIAKGISRASVSSIGGAKSEAGSATDPATADPWELEMHGAHREIYELQQMPAAARRHVALARRAAHQYQSFDAFARVAMTFGTHQLLHAIAYYCLGYVGVQDGAPAPAVCIHLIMVLVAMGLMNLNLSLTQREQALAQVLSIVGPMCVSAAASVWCFYGASANSFILSVLPIAYASHGLWLLWALKACGVKKQPNGSWLPTKFRAVLYLDVFGWLSPGSETTKVYEDEENLTSTSDDRDYQPMVSTGENEYAPLVAPSPNREPSAPELQHHRSLSTLQEDVREQIALWQSEKVQRVLDEREKERVEQLAHRVQATVDQKDEGGLGLESGDSCGAGEVPQPSARKWVKLHGYSDLGTEAPYFYNPETGAVKHIEEASLRNGSEGQCAGSAVPRGHSVQSLRTITAAEEDVETYCTRSVEVSRRTSCASGIGKVPQAGPAGAASVSKPSEALLGQASSIFERSEGAAKQVSSQMSQAFAWCGEDGVDRCSNPDTEEAVHTVGDADDSSGAGPPCSGDMREPVSSCRVSFGPSEQHHGHRDVPATGPSGAVHHAPEHAFHPKSFTPSVRQEAGPTEEDSDIVTGHDRMGPGRLPWKIFRSATLFLVFLWFFGLSLPFGVFRDFMTQPLTAEIEVKEDSKHGEREVRVAVGTDPSGLPVLEYIPETNRHLPALPEGELIHADWPSHSGFVPRALSSDPSGRQLVVADDFGVYAGPLRRQEQEDHTASVSADSSVMERRLRVKSSSSRTAPKVVLSAHFRHVPTCTALEGQALKDIGVVCAGGSLAACRVLVLHSHGRRLAECPLSSKRGGSHSHGANAVSALPPGRAANAMNPNVTWEIVSDWLHSDGGKREHVDSLAVDSECLGGSSAGHGFAGSFQPDKVGCVVVGTTSGRIVQLRRHMTDEARLVPERAMQQRSQAVSRGSLNVFPDGFVMALRKRTGTVQAFGARAGNMIGEWRLPKHIAWVTLCGGGDSIYILGHEKRTIVRLYRFPVPPQLRGYQEQPEAAHEFHGQM